MPTYEYSCPKCGQFETIQKITEPALTECPTCGSPVQRLVSAPAFHLKGSGWYKTDYAQGKNTGSSASSSGSSSSSTSEPKPASTSTDSSSATAAAPAAAPASTGSAAGPKAD